MASLITNAAKHAYPAETGGPIVVRLVRRGDIVTLCVSDRGSGLPDASSANSGVCGLGMRIVRTLTTHTGSNSGNSPRKSRHRVRNYAAARGTAVAFSVTGSYRRSGTIPTASWSPWEGDDCNQCVTHARQLVLHLLKAVVGHLRSFTGRLMVSAAPPVAFVGRSVARQPWTNCSPGHSTLPIIGGERRERSSWTSSI